MRMTENRANITVDTSILRRFIAEFICKVNDVEQIPFAVDSNDIYHLQTKHKRSNQVSK